MPVARRRARGIGLGWVSILDPCAVTDILDVPPGWHLVAYLCLGLPQEEHPDPELERHGWQEEDRRARTLRAVSVTRPSA